MNLTTIHAGLFKLDGGAMFGVVPKQMWKRLNPPDENNMCTWAMRCLLIEQGDRRILIDTGMGEKQDAKFRSHFEPHGEQNLLDSLRQAGCTPEDITDVFLTHLHFDHGGGALRKNDQGEIVPTFPNATYWTNRRHLDWALDPNPRERASFLKENIVPLQEAGKLKFVETTEGAYWTDHFRIHFVNGHTEQMMLPRLEFPNGDLLFGADLFPSAYHIGLPYVMSYDIRPLDTLQEKKRMLEQAMEKTTILFFEHDPVNECGLVGVNERGRYIIKETMPLSDALHLLK